MKNQRDAGMITIETILSLSIFMFAFVTLLSIAAIAKVESTTQYAIDQIAKEISQYYYIADRIGLPNTDDSGVEEIDNTIQAVFNFADKSKNAVNTINNATTGGLMDAYERFGDVKNDVESVTAAAQELYNSFGPIFNDPKGILKSLTAMMARELGNEVISKIIAQPICRVLMSKYITSNGDADAALEKMGVEYGLDGLDFRMSSFLTDQRTINVVLIYKLKVNGFGLFDDELVIKQTASTAAWVTGAPLREVNERLSNWEKADFERGKTFVAEVKGENADEAVASGVGIDLYDQDSNTFTSIYSMNIFNASYSDYNQVSDDPSNPDNYTLKENSIKNTLKHYANDLLNDIDDVGEFIKMEDGTSCQTADESVMPRSGELIIVVPDEGRSDAEFLEILNRIAAEIEAETGVKVNFTYRDDAFGG